MKLSILSLLLVFSACAAPVSNQKVSSEKDFEVPSALADKFVVKDETSIPVAAAPVEPVKVVKKITDKKKKKEKVKVVAAPVVEPKKEEFPNRWSMAPFFVPGEKYRFDITYFGATAGDFRLEVMPPKMVDDRLSFHIRGTASTASVFSLFYRMNDVAESFMDATGLFSHKFVLKLDESLQQRDVLELYDQRKHSVHYWSKLDHKKKGKKQEQFEIATAPFAQDSVSAFFYLRTLPLVIGESYQFPVVNNGKLREVKVTVLRKETITTKLGEIPAIVLKPEVVLDGALKSYGDSFVWISDDPRRIILKIDAKIKVGSVIAYLREYSGGSPQPAR